MRRKRIERHGMSRTRLYRIHKGVKSRCYISSDTSYPRYGRKGVRMCPAWRRSFKAFAAWALANGYSEELTLDRRDNSKGYNPGNARWATRKQQARNRRRRRRRRN